MIGMGLGSMKSTINYKLIRFHQTFISASDGMMTRGYAQHIYVPIGKGLYGHNDEMLEGVKQTCYACCKSSI